MRMRMNISIPELLKSRIDAIEGVNWSAVAQQAFEAKLAAIAREKRKGNEMRIDIEAVASRLKTTGLPENRTQSRTAKIGHNAGTEWASETASLEQLERLPEASEFFEGVPSGLSRAEILFARITDVDFQDDDFDSAEFSKQAEDFYDQCLSKSSDSRLVNEEDFARGFLDAATAVYEAVKNKL